MIQTCYKFGQTLKEEQKRRETVKERKRE